MGFLANALTGGGSGLSNDFRAELANIGGYDYTGDIGATLRDVGAAKGLTLNSRTKQDDLIAALLAQAEGRGPSVAQQQLQQGTEQSIRQLASVAGSSKGVSPAIQAKMIADNAGYQNQAMVGQSAMTRLQEQMAARSALGQAINSQRGQDVSMYGQQSGLAQALGSLQNQGNSVAVDNQMRAQGLNAGVAEQNSKFGQDLVGGLLGSAGAAGGKLATGGGMYNGGFVDALYEGGYPSLGVDTTMPTIEGYSPALPKEQNDFLSAISKQQIDPKASGGAKAGQGMAQGLAGLASMIFNDGGFVPGKAPVKGDAPENDVVPALLSPDEIVIPRTKAKSPKKAKDFIDALFQQDHRISEIERFMCGGRV